MNKKEILIICLIMCCIFSLQTAVAADVDVDNNDTGLLKIQNLDDVSADSLPDSQDTLQAGSGSAGTFSDLQSKIDQAGEELTLENNYTWATGDTTTGVTISNDIKIIGYGVTIDANKKSRVFNIDSTAHVTLEGITFINGKISGTGGSINGGILTIYNCTFINSTSSSDGGAVYTDNIAKLFNVTFINCTSSGSRAGAARLGVDSNVSNSRFINNTAATYGGAVYVAPSPSSEGPVFYNTEFINNRVRGTGTGGAINIGSDGRIKMISNCTFINNTAAKEGGAIKTTGSIYIIGSRFINNTAGSNGGAIYGSGMKDNTALLTIINSNFTGNNATGSGGAVYSGYANVTNSSFILNTATNNGGAMYVDGNRNMNATNTNFTSNVAKNDGGALRVFTAKINHSIFTGNNATNTAGALKVVYDTVVSNSSFINNHISGNGGTYGGGAISATGTNTISTTLTIYDSNFTRNSVSSFGGAIRGDAYTTILVNNSNFSNNRANGTSRDGGALYILSSNSKVSNSTFINNTATRYGGDIYWSGTSGIVEYSNFTGSNATTSGGSIYVVGDSTKIIYSNFTSHHASTGGAVYISGSDVTLNNTIFKNNNATSGGAIYATGSSSIITYSNFTGNNATSGGAIYSYGTSSYAQSTPITISYSNFTDNHAINNAGAVYIGHNSNIEYCNFTANTATNGGAAVIAILDARILNSIFKNNNATELGGAIYAQTVDRAYILDSTFIACYADNGGAIYNEGNIAAGLSINNDTFMENVAYHNGGAIYYVVDNGLETEKVYRDYNHFDNQEETVGDRISVDLKNSAGTSRGKYIVNCLITDDNRDYMLNVSSKGMLSYHGGIVSIYNPDDIDLSSINLLINITDITGGGSVLIQSITIDPDNFDTDWYNPIEKSININIRNLEYPHTYNATIGFSDKNYIYKVNSTVFTVETSQEIGDFQIIKQLIQEAIIRGDNEVNLTRSYSYNELDIDNHTGCINISTPTSFTINGRGFTINAEGYCRIFNITSANVTLNNVILKGGNASGRDGDGVEIGGGIFWSGVNGTLNNVTIDSNYAKVSGGGLYLNYTAADARIIDSTFINNYAEGNGGAIDCNATRMHLSNTLFENNYGLYGAALCRESEATNGSGENNAFVANHAVKGGAALGWIEAHNITIVNYTFINNTAGESGGAIFVGVNSISCRVIDCIFEGNYIDNETSGHGGAIEWYADEGYVINSNFTGNHAFDGGAIYANDESKIINITKSRFEDNYAYSRGGAISLEASEVIISYSNFINNTAITSGGGAIYVGGSGTSNNVSFSNFTDNRAPNGNGGAIDWVASAGHVINATFTNNSAIYGGGIYLNGVSHNSGIYNTTFIYNNATKNGGAIDWNATNGELLHNVFISNEADYGAALCRESDANGGNGRDNNFTSNYARISGPALGWMGSDKITIINYGFFNNTADVSGGAIYVSEESNNCSVIDCIFEGNYVTNVDEGEGGAIDWNGANGTVIRSNFSDNRAFNGGAIFVGSNHGTTNITDSSFIENTAYNNGGAIDLNASSVILNNSYFKQNRALNGGAVFVGEKGTSNYIYKSRFEQNNATGSNGEGYGGAIDWLAASGHIIYSNFTKNYADYGGAVYLNGKSNNSVIDHVIFDGNEANYNGGAIDWDAQNGNLTNTTFKNNKAQYGAALCRETGATGGSGKDNIFEYNHAYKSGAALAWMGSVGIKIINYTFNYNTAGESGAAIYISETSHNCSIIDSRFTGNNITGDNIINYGGAIYCAAQNATVNNSNFTDNNARYGGAIFVGSDGGYNNISDSKFIKNHAVRDGGAIYLTSSHTTINRTEFTNNTAVNGGAIYANGTGQINQVYKSLFDNNRANGGYGGAINWVASAGYIYYSNFTNNYAENGGAIHFNGLSDNSKISHVRFENNTATENGGAIDCDSKEMELTYTDFISNYANYGAALCREPGATGGFGHNNTFDKNHAYISGAALAWLNVSDITINNYTFTNNTAEVSGAAIFVDDSSDNCKVHNCRFEDNFITNAISGRGGAIDWIGDKGEVINTTFDACVAVEAGAIYVAETSNNMTIVNVSFTSCRATDGNGGALELRGDNVTINSTNFTSCFSLKSGGAIASINSDNLTIVSARFISCVSFDFGGAIAGIRSDNANITDCYFKYGHAAGHTNPDGTLYGEGGAISWVDSTNLNVYDSIFSSNNAYLSGGSISANNCNDSTVYNIKTYNDTAEFNGGSVSWINSNNVTIEHSLFNDSGSNYNGGSIYLGNVDNITVKDILFNSTWASWGYGGGLYVGGNVTLNNITLRDGHDYADKANGIFFEYGNSTVVNSTFNETTNVIYINKNANVNLTNNNITGDYPTKNVTYLLKNDVNNRYEVDYAVWNDGDLYLSNIYNNTFDYVIINNGTIESHVTIYVLNNDTVNATWDDNYLFKLRTIDDNNNTIISVSSTSWNNVTGEVEPYFYPLDYNAASLHTIYQGSYQISAKDLGFKNYDIKPGTINVKVNTKVELTYDGPNNGVVTVNVKVINLTQNNRTLNGGKVFLKLGDNLNKTVIIDENGLASWTVSGLAAKSYAITANYEGTMYHNPSENSTGVDVVYWDSWIRVQADNVAYGNIATAVVTSNSNGTVIITLNGRKYAEIVLGDDRREEVTLPDNLLPGNYSIGAILLTNNYYNFAMNNTDLIVLRLNTSIEAVPTTPIMIGGNEIIDVTVNETAANGFIKITINNKEYVETVNQGIAQFNISGLANGTYNNIPIEYLGNDIYNGNSTRVSFVVGKTSDYEMKVITRDIVYGNDAVVYVVLPSSVTEKVIISVDGQTGEEVTVDEGIATLVITKPTVGTHTVDVTYPGDTVFAQKTADQKQFTVSKADCHSMNVSADDVAVGVNTTITVTVPTDANGTVTIWVNGASKNKTARNSGGQVVFSLNKTIEGIYTINATLTNDGKYNDRTVYSDYYVYRVDAPITIDSVTLHPVVGQNTVITVKVPTSVDESLVTLKIDGNSYNGDKDGDTVTFTIDDLTGGNKTVFAIFAGDGKYKFNSTTKNFTVYRQDSSIAVSAGDKNVGESVRISLTSISDGATGYVVVNVIGVDNYTINLTSGPRYVDVKGLAAGTYYVNATYIGDGKYLSSYDDSASFIVNQIDSDINLTVSEGGIIAKGNNVNITIEAPINATGKVNVTLWNGTKKISSHIVYVNDGEGILHLDSPAVGVYNVTAVYLGDGKYRSSNDKTSFEVFENAGSLVVIAPNVYVDDTNTITVEITGKHEGNVTIIISDDSGVLSRNETTIIPGDVKSTATLSIGLMEAGNYNVSAKFVEVNGTKTTVYEGTGNFEVYKLASEIKIDKINATIYVGEDETIVLDITLDSRHDDGDISVFVNGVEHTTTTSDLTVVIPDLNATSYDVLVVYHGNDWYNESTSTSSFEVIKNPSPIEVTVTNSTVGSVEQINVILPDDASGQVLLDINGQHYYANVTGGRVQFNITCLKADEYEFNVTYSGNYKYMANDSDATLTVSKLNATGIVVSADNITYSNKTNIVVTVPTGITGNITLRLNDTGRTNVTLDIVGGKVVWAIDKLPAGKYEVSATYNGNYKYNVNDTLSGKFMVYKLDPDLEIVSVDSVAGKNATITIRINGETKGDTVNITGLDKSYNNVVIQEGGIVTLETDGSLNYDDYTVKVSYGGSDNFNYSSVSYPFHSDKISDYTITVNPVNITFKDDEIITVTVPEGVTDVSIWVNGNKETNNSVTGTEAKFNATKYIEGTGVYFVNATVNDVQYASKVANNIFTVAPRNTTLLIHVHNVDIWNKEYINVTIKDTDGNILKDASGKVNITINDVDQPVTIDSGVAKFNTSNLVVGENTVRVFYAGDRNYMGNCSVKTFTVNQRTPKASVTAVNVTIDTPTTITVTIPGNATGFVIVTGNFTDNEIYIANNEFTGGVATIDVGGLSEGVYSVHIKYYGLGTDAYSTVEKDSSFKVSKLNTTVGIVADGVVYGRDVNVVVTVDDGVEGNITIKLGDKTIGTYAILDNKVEVTLSGLAADDYTVYAIYNGNDKYNINNTESKDFTVSRATPVITIDEAFTDAVTGAKVTVHINDTATGTITIAVNGTSYIRAIDGGVAEFTVDVLPVGDYNITASYAPGDDKNYSEVSGVIKENGLHVGKVAVYPMNVSALDVGVGENTTITVTVPGGAIGTVTIFVDGTRMSNATSGGKAIFHLNKTSEGRYSINATLTDDKYADQTAYGNYYVYKVDTPISITDVVVDESTATITVNVPADIEGIVTIEINGKVYNNGHRDGDAVTFTVNNLIYGDKTVVATYAGDNKYKFNSTTKNFTVGKSSSSISVDATNGTVDGNVVINVTVSPGATGFVIVDVNGTNYTINLTAGADSVTVEGLGNGTYNVIATYIGDDTYRSSYDTTSFEVYKLNTTVRIDVDDITYGDDANITVYVDNGVEGTITIRIDSKVLGTYDIVDGKVNVSAHNIGAGDRTVYAEYNGNYKYNENRTASKGFTVDKATPTITIDHAVVDANTGAVIYVHINPDAVGNITICAAGNGVSSTYIYEAPIVDGVAEFTLDVLPVNKYNITADFYDDMHGGEDTNYTMHSVWAIYALIVNKVTDYPITVNTTDVKAGEETTIVVTVPDDATGRVFIDVNGTKKNATVSEGKVIFYVTEDIAGRYVVNATLVDDKYANKAVIGNYYVDYADTQLDIVIDEPVYANDTAIITVTVPDDIDGVVTIEINGKSYNNVTVVANKVRFEVPIISYGNKTVVAIFEGNYKYHAKSVTANFTVSKRDSSISVDATNGTVGGDVIINVTVTPEATGYVIVDVNGTEYAINLTAGEDRITVKNLGYGEYNVIATYLGDDIYLLKSDSCSFNVSDTSHSIELDIENITYGDVETVTVNVNATGSVTIKLNNETYDTKDLSGGKVVFPIEGLDAGNYTVEAIYTDPSGNVNSVKANFTVEKADPEITVEVKDIVYGDVEHIKVNSNAKGNVTIKVNESVVYELTLENGHYVLRAVRSAGSNYKGNANVDVENLEAGKYTVEVTYNGNENYNPLTVTKEFYVFKANTSVSVQIEPSVPAGESQVMNITMANGNETGKVIIYIDGKNYTRTVTNGAANFTIPPLAGGNHTVVVIYEGDGNFNANWTSITVNVEKSDSSISVDVISGAPGDDVVISVDVSAGATGYVVVDVNGTGYVVNLTAGEDSLTISGLSEGVYNVVATYVGDDYYDSSSDAASFKVEKVDSYISVDATNSTAGEEVIIDVAVTPDATGYVVVDVNGAGYIINLTDGKGSITLKNLPADTYDVVATYIGDDNHKSSEDTTSFKVEKVSSSLSVEMTDNPAGSDQTITVIVDNDDSTGYVIVDVDGETYAVKLNNGKGSITISGLTAGNHTINATYLGNDVYSQATSNIAAELPELSSDVSVSVENITVGDSAVIEISVPENATGNVTVNVDGDDYTVYVAGGKGTLVVSDLGVGPHKVTVTYNGDGIYESGTDSTSFEVTRKDAGDAVKVTDKGDGTVVVEVPEYSKGNVTIKVGDDTYTGEIVDGKAVIELENATPGVHDITVTVPGDENHADIVMDTTATIPKEETSFDVSVENIEVGDKAVIVVKVPEGASGNVTVEIDGKSYTEPIVGDEARFEIEGLTAGNKTAVIRYDGDVNYDSNITSAAFNVSKANATIKVTINDSSVGDNVTVDVVLPDDAKGVVLIDIGGVGYYANVTDGVAHVDIPRIPSGYYEVGITYTGDDKYSSASNKTSFNMSKVDSFVIPNAIDIVYGENEVITLNVPEDATGNVTVIINGMEYTLSSDEGILAASSSSNTYVVAVSGGKGTITISGLPEGEYYVSARYNGDDKYFTVTNSTTFKVTKSELFMNVTDQGNGTVLVELPGDAEGNVTVELGGQEYVASVENGKAWITLDGATPGIHDITVTYSGDEKYNSVTDESSVVIPKYNSPIGVDVDDIHVDDTLNVVISLPDSATGNVTVEIDGTEYPAVIDGDKAVVNVTGLTAGNKTLVVKYSGDDNYLPNTTTVQFEVSKVDSTVSATPRNITAGNDEVITVNVPSDASGRVLVNVNGVGYYANIINGMAKVIIPDLDSGKYTVNVIYEGDDKYLPSTTTISFTVTKAKSAISISGSDIKIGDDETITVSVPSDATGTVSIKIAGKTYTEEVSDGKAVFVISGLSKGTYNITAIYSGDDKYEESESSSVIKVEGNETPDHNNTYKPVKGEGIMLSVYPTANPIYLLLLILFVIGSTKSRKFKK